MKATGMAMTFLFLLLLCGCSAEYMRERDNAGMKNGVITDIHKYCLEYPKDSACQGKESK